jgi:hypothetical protein
MLALPRVLFVMLCLFAGSALAVPTWTVNSLNSIGCAASTTNFSTTVASYTGGIERFRTQVDSGGLRYMDEDAGVPGLGNGSYAWALYASATGGPTSGTWPIPAGQPVTVNFMFINGAGGPIVYWRQIVLSRCDGGTIVSDQVYLDSSSASCVGFGDVPAAAGYCPSVQWLKNRAITLGCTSTTYCPNDGVTRAQMALFMNRLGAALEPKFISANDSLAAAGVNAQGVVCQTSSFVVGNAPVVGTASAMLYHTAPTAQLVTARIVYSTNGGSTWQNFSPFYTLASNVVGGYVTQSPVANPVPFTVGQLVKFGIRTGEFGAPPTVTVAGCNLTVRIDNRNGTSFPFDVATQTGPSTGAPNTGLPSDLNVPMQTPAPLPGSNNR